MGLLNTLFGVEESTPTTDLLEREVALDRREAKAELAEELAKESLRIQEKILEDKLVRKDKNRDSKIKRTEDEAEHQVKMAKKEAELTAVQTSIDELDEKYDVLAGIKVRELKALEIEQRAEIKEGLLADQLARKDKNRDSKIKRVEEESQHSVSMATAKAELGVLETKIAAMREAHNAAIRAETEALEAKEAALASVLSAKDEVIAVLEKQLENANETIKLLAKSNTERPDVVVATPASA